MNSLLKKLHKGQKALGVFATMNSPMVTRSLATAGLDFIFIDQQHGLLDSSDTDQMITAIFGTDCTPIVRVANNDSGQVMAALDRGALAVVCPLVNTGSEARHFTHALRYPPEGGRSWGPMKPNLYYGADYTQRANKEVMAIAQIETKTAVENMDAILASKGLDAVLVGPNDLGFTYGNQPMSMPQDPIVQEAMREIAKACKARGVFPGIHCGDAKMAKEMFDWGYDFASVGTDFGYLQHSAKAVIEEVGRQSIPSASGY